MTAKRRQVDSNHPAQVVAESREHLLSIRRRQTLLNKSIEKTEFILRDSRALVREIDNVLAQIRSALIQ